MKEQARDGDRAARVVREQHERLRKSAFCARSTMIELCAMSVIMRVAHGVAERRKSICGMRRAARAWRAKGGFLLALFMRRRAYLPRRHMPAAVPRRVMKRTAVQQA